MYINRLKIFYIGLCVFFIMGSFATTVVVGEQMEIYPDLSWNTPKNVIGYYNNYINQKVNPSTMGDILVTEYLEHPQEATGVIPLFPTQSIVQEMDYVNATITDMELEIIPGEDPVYGTTVGIAVFVKTSPESRWKLQVYETKSTAWLEVDSLTVSIELPKIAFDEQGGRRKIVITNFGTEIADLVYIPTINLPKDNIQFSGINTVVDTEKSLYLTVMNNYQLVRGYWYLLDYKKHVGVQLHQLEYYRTEKGDIQQKSDEIVALFDYPSFHRVDSELYKYNAYESTVATVFSMFDNLINNDYSYDHKEPFNYSLGTVFQKNYHEPITDSFYLNHSEPIDSEMYYRHDKNFDGIMDWPLQLISSKLSDPYPLVGLVKNFTSSPRFDQQTIINARNGSLKWSPSLNYYNESVTYHLELLPSDQSEITPVLTRDLTTNEWCANTTPITEREYIIRLTTLINNQSLIVIETEIIVSTDQTAGWDFLSILFGLPFLLVVRKKQRKKFDDSNLDDG